MGPPWRLWKAAGWGHLCDPGLCAQEAPLVYGSAVGEQLADAPSHGWPVPPVAPQTHVLPDHVRREVDRLTTFMKPLDRAGVALVRGWDRFLDERRLQVGEQTLRGETILIAVGGQPLGCVSKMVEIAGGVICGYTKPPKWRLKPPRRPRHDRCYRSEQAGAACL